MASVRALYETMRALREGVAPRNIANVAGGDLMNQATREPAYHGWIK
jgi:hypothetical protein